MRRPRKKRVFPQGSGVSNDFFSANRKKKHGSLKLFLFNKHKNKILEEQIKKINLIDAREQKEIHMEFIFPEPVETRSKNNIKHHKTLQKRLERLVNTEKFWPYVYKDLKKIEGKIIEVESVKHYRDGRIVMVWSEDSRKVWNETTREHDGPKPILSRSQVFVNEKKFFGMTTGFVIVCMDTITIKPGQIVAVQVLFDDKLLFIDVSHLAIKSRSFGSFGSK